jgi:hypothetical protein
MAALLVPALPVEAQSTVGTSTTAYSVSYNFQQNVFYVSGRFWVFYHDGSNLVYRTSTDNGTTWSGATTVVSGFGCYYGAESFASCYDGAYFHYARQQSTGSIYYRRGILNSDNTITWSAAEQLVGSNIGKVAAFNPTSIAVDSSGHAYITYRAITTEYPTVIADNTTNGTWVTATGFPYTCDNTSASGAQKVLALTGNKVYVLYIKGQYAGKVYGQLCDSGWGGEETVVDYTLGSVAAWAAVANGDVIEVSATNGTWRSETRSAAGSWSEVSLQTNSITTPTLTLLPGGDLIVSGLVSSTKHIWTLSRLGGAWGDWFDWIDESTDGGLGVLKTAISVHQSNKVGVLYQTKSGSPYNVKFAYYNSYTAPTVTTLSPSLRYSYSLGSYATLSGNVTLGSESVSGYFDYGIGAFTDTVSLGTISASGTSTNETHVMANKNYQYRFRVVDTQNTTLGNTVNFTSMRQFDLFPNSTVVVIVLIPVLVCIGIFAVGFWFGYKGLKEQVFKEVVTGLVAIVIGLVLLCYMVGVINNLLNS